MSMREIHARFVLPFPNDFSRPRLYNNLARWIEDLRAARIGATLWVNGSFVTTKPNPADLDCVLWNPAFLDDIGTPHELLRLTNSDDLRTCYQMDFRVEIPHPRYLLHRQAYWKGLFGFQHDGVSAKGFVEIEI
jgi:hypothetical protein